MRICIYPVCGKPWEKVSPILVTLTSRSDSDFERSNHSLKENKPDGVDPNPNDLDYYVRKNDGKILSFSADCYRRFSLFFLIYITSNLTALHRFCEHMQKQWFSVRSTVLARQGCFSAAEKDLLR